MIIIQTQLADSQVCDPIWQKAKNQKYPVTVDGFIMWVMKEFAAEEERENKTEADIWLHVCMWGASAYVCFSVHVFLSTRTVIYK